MDKKKSLFPLWTLIGVFLVPPIASILVHLTNKDKPLTTTQHGIFFKESIYLNINQTKQNLSKNWSLIFIEPDICQTDCLEKKQMLNNLHIALGKDQKRVKNLVISNKVMLEHSKLFTKTSVIILDPNGLAIMYYTASAKPSGILKDLRKLLKNSYV